jgi:hypothetical protein
MNDLINVVYERDVFDSHPGACVQSGFLIYPFTQKMINISAIHVTYKDAQII